MKIILLALAINLTVTAAQASCEVALYVLKNQPGSPIIQKMTKAFDQVLKKVNKDNQAYAVSGPLQAQDADYMYLVIPESNGKISVSVNNLLLNQNLYRNVYNSDAFISENAVVKTLATDFETEALPELKYCQDE